MRLSACTHACPDVSIADCPEAKHACAPLRCHEFVAGASCSEVQIRLCHQLDALEPSIVCQRAGLARKSSCVWLGHSLYYCVTSQCLSQQSTAVFECTATPPTTRMQSTSAEIQPPPTGACFPLSRSRSQSLPHTACLPMRAARNTSHKQPVSSRSSSASTKTADNMLPAPHAIPICAWSWRGPWRLLWMLTWRWQLTCKVPTLQDSGLWGLGRQNRTVRLQTRS